MNCLDQLKVISYSSVDVTLLAGVQVVSPKQILDILEQRAILLLRQCASPKLGDRETQFHRGQYDEVMQLRKALSEKYNEI